MIIESFKSQVFKSSVNSVSFCGLHGSSFSLALSQVIESNHQSVLVVCENNEQADQVYKELCFFGSSAIDLNDVFLIPDTETLPYDQESPHSSIVSQRAGCFNRLSTSRGRKVVITSIPNVVQRISSLDYWKNGRIDLSLGDIINKEEFSAKLLSFGYKETKRDIAIHGEFSSKNNVFDLFPFGSPSPIRFRLANNCEIKSICEFSLSTQRSGASVDSFSVLVAKEMPVDEAAFNLFKKSFRLHFGRSIGHIVYESVASGEIPPGAEYYLPLFQDTTSTIFDLLDFESGISIISKGDFSTSISSHLNTINKRYDDIKGDERRRVLEPHFLWITEEEMGEVLKKSSVYSFKKDCDEPSLNLSIESNGIERQKGIKETIACISAAMSRSAKTVFCYHSNVREEQIKSILDIMNVKYHQVNDWASALRSESKAIVVSSVVDTGFFVAAERITIVSEKDLFGQPIYAKNEDDFDEGIDYSGIQDLKNLELGDPVVHIKYGVGRFAGLKTMMLHGVNREYMSITFAKNSSSYVPMDELDYVSRYGGMSTEKAPLDELGAEKWLMGLDEAMRDIETTSTALLRIQAEKKAKKGVAFNKPTFEYQKFCKEFPFQETRDQRSAIADIIKDMTSEIPMDRTIVGDVGFGKTEVAMRAAFIAASSGYQVAVVVPTTLLAQQHFENFKSRFSSFNIGIAYLSKSNKAEEKRVLDDMKTGKVSVVISTHRLLQDDVKFQKLGLLIIDEEHRFGVAQKEKLRSKRLNLDVLSMTATPIPRTLSMSMSGIRDLSIIATPPAKRLSIRTIVEPYSEEIIRESIQRELIRKGQAFFLHNTIETIEDKAEQLRQLIPGLRVGVCHGAMKERQIEEVMGQFYKREFDLLVCTTIIETGIDVPNANTIIIENADNFGIAQLHQLRGRVGRSHHQAYAYLLISKAEISDSASKRLMAMEKATNLGEGFVLANHDLEIRGSGELLGEEQSGHIQNIGFALYMRLLNRAIDIIKSGRSKITVSDIIDATKLDINTSGFIDPNYIENEHERLSYYKRLASAANIDEIDSIADEMEDKYGEIHEGTVSLMGTNKLRCYLRQVGIKKLIADATGGFIQVSDDAAEVAEKLIHMAVDAPETFEVVGPSSVKFSVSLKNDDDRLNYVVSLVTAIT